MKHVGTDLFLLQVAKSVRAERPGIARILGSLRNDSVILRGHAERLLALPVDPDMQMQSPIFEREMHALSELKAAVHEGVGTATERLVRALATAKQGSHAGALRLRARSTCERHLTRIMVDHFRRQGLLTWDGTSLPSLHHAHVAFNGFPFSAAGYSYLRPMLRWRGNKPIPRPVLIDVLGRDCTLHDAEGFVARLGRTRQGRRVPHPLGVIAAPWFNEDALRFARNENLMAVSLNQLFGEAAFQAMVIVEELLAQLGAEDSTDDVAAARLEEVLTDLKANPYVAEMRAISFEAIAALVLRAKGFENVVLGTAVPFKNTTRDLDVSGDRSDHEEAYFIECKALRADEELASADVKKFFTETVPAARRHLFDHFPSFCQAEIWTTGTIGADARSCLNSLSLPRQIVPGLRGKDEVTSEIPRRLKRLRRLLETIAV